MHGSTIPAGAGQDNVKGPASPDTPLSAGPAQLSLFSVPELVSDEIHRWAERERALRPGVTHGMLLHALASRLGLVNARQVYRYMSGETPFHVEKLVVLCRTISSWKLLQALNQEAGLVAEPKPDVGKLEGFDLIIEQSHNLKEFGELVAAYAEATNHVPSEIELKRVEKEGREAIQQIERLIRLYREMVARQVVTR